MLRLVSDGEPPDGVIETLTISGRRRWRTSACLALEERAIEKLSLPVRSEARRRRPTLTGDAVPALASEARLASRSISRRPPASALGTCTEPRTALPRWLRASETAAVLPAAGGEAEPGTDPAVEVEVVRGGCVVVVVVAPGAVPVVVVVLAPFGLTVIVPDMLGPWYAQ
jgi:hypothetical protein